MTTGTKLDNLTASGALAGTERVYVRGSGDAKATVDQISDRVFAARSVDEDDMVSNSATKLPTQQSTKAYVDSAVSGKATGAGTATDNAIARYDGTTGKTIQNSGVTIDDSNNVSGAVSLQRTGGVAVQGTNTNDDASAGYAGEQAELTVAFGSAVSLTDSTAANVGSFSLTAGDWDVSGIVHFSAAATTSVTQLIGSLSTTSATLDQTAPRAGFYATAANVINGIQSVAIPRTRIKLASTTTIYLVARGKFTVSTLSAYGYALARRIR